MLDAEAAVIQALTELMAPAEVSSELPANASLPRLRVSRLGGSTDMYGWIDKPRIYIEAWAETKTDAWALASGSLTALLTSLPGAQFADGTVTHVQPDAGLSWSPDPDTQRPRYLFSVVLTTHPNQ